MLFNKITTNRILIAIYPIMFEYFRREPNIQSEDDGQQMVYMYGKYGFKKF